MKRLFSGIAIAALALAIAACAGGPKLSADQQLASSEAPQPALWAVRDADSTLYLYGTVHLRKPGAPWGGPAARRALTASAEVWTELEFDPSADAVLQQQALQLGVDPAAKLSDKLSDELKPRFAAAAESLGLPPAALDPLKPWLAAITFSITSLVKAGYDPQSGVDRLIDAEAEALGKTMRWFETGDQQIGFLAGLSEPVQLQMLSEAVDQTLEGSDQMVALETAWERGDAASLEAMLDEGWDGYPELYDVLIVKRNAAWVKTLQEELNGSGVDFVAVGAAHLVGDESVIAMLQAAGHRVEQVTPAPN